MRLLFLLLAFLVAKTIYPQDLDFSVSNIAPELLKGADAVVRHDRMQVFIESHQSMRVENKRVVTVLNEEGQKFVQAYAFYDNEQKITALSAVVFDSNGNEIEKFKERDFLDYSATDGGTLYSDSRVKFLRYTPTQYPYTLVFNKSYKTSDTAFIPNWFFLDGYRVSTERSDYILTIQCDVPVRYKESNLEAFGVSAKRTPYRYSYHAENLRAIEREPYSPSINEFSPQVKFALEKFHLKGVDGTAQSWKTFGAWMYNSLLQGQDVLDEATKNKIRKLVWGIEDPLEKVKKVYEFVQNNTRYISVQLGIGGWKPISAIEVDKVKYGDCKGLTNYTRALLKEVGIESHYTIVYGDPLKRDLDPDFPSLQGNHVFLNVPLQTDELWLECTNQQIPANFLGTFTDDRYVLKVTPDGGELVRSAKYNETDSRQHTAASISIDNSARISAEVQIVSTGIQYGQKYGLASKKFDEQEQHYKDYWDYVNNIKIIGVQLHNDKDAIEFHENLSVRTDDYISRAGDQWLFVPNMFNRNLNVPKRVRNRTRDVVVRRGYLDEDEFIIQIPDGYKIDTLLPKVNIKTDFGEYTLNMKRLEGSKIQYQRRLLVRTGRFPKERYKEFREFRKKVARSDNAKILITKI